MRFLQRGDAPRTAAGAEDPESDGAPLAEELRKLRRTVLRQGHAQELFQARVEEAIERLESRNADAEPAVGALGEPQVRALLELDQALLQLLRLAGRQVASGAGEPPAEDRPRSLGEGLSLLQVRVRNLQHSMGLDAIPAAGQQFDDRWHRACGVVHRPDLPEDTVVEEVLPGYRLGDRVVRPAMVVVNRRPEPGSRPEAPPSDPRADDPGRDHRHLDPPHLDNTELQPSRDRGDP